MEETASPVKIDVGFPPSDKEVGVIIELCGRQQLPLYFGENVELDDFNEWIGKSETGLRVSYVATHKAVLLREVCNPSHAETRMELRQAMKTAFVGTHKPRGGRIQTPVGFQDVTPDVALSETDIAGVTTFPVVAEVGGSQSEAKLLQRAKLLFAAVPGVQVVILVKVHDDTTHENGRLYVWCLYRGPGGGALQQTSPVEFGRTRAHGALLVPWAMGTPEPTFQVPAHNAVPATTVPLGAILEQLREGDIWLHGAPP